MRFTQIFFGNRLQFKYWKRYVEREMHGDQVGTQFHLCTLNLHFCKRKQNLLVQMLIDFSAENFI